MATIQLAMRVDDVDGAFEAVKDYLNVNSIGGFGVREAEPSNVHYHFLLEGFKEKKDVQAFRVALTRKCPMLKGNGGYSITIVKDLDKYERYITKGASDGEAPQIVWRQSLIYNDAKISELHDAYWAENQKMKKRAAGSMVDFVVDEAKRQCICWSDRHALNMIYIEEMEARSKPLNTFAGKAVINMVQIKLCPTDEAKRQFAELM